MNNKIYPVILAGGTGTRLWPRSREKHPKQFIKLFDEHSLFQKTCLRFSNREDFSFPTIITNSEHRFIVRDQLHDIGIKDAYIIAEPMQKNTIAACLSGANFLKNLVGNVPILFTPADHLISEEQVLFSAIQDVLPYVLNGSLCLFGITPISPHVGYGYIVSNKNLSANIFTETSFVEKPTLEKAQELIKDGACWNSGIYFCLAETLIEEAKKYTHRNEAILSKFTSVSVDEHGFLMIPVSVYDDLDSISIDKAITEHTDKIIVVHTPIKWRDLGSWMSLYEHFEKGENGNVIRGDVIALGTKNSYIESTSRLVTIFGLEDIGLVETSDAILVFPLKEGELVKKIVTTLSEAKREELVTHTQVHRPWGQYEILGKGNNFQSKKITVLPGAQLSLQSHKHRAEHWIITSGIATVTKGNDVFLLHRNESTFISAGQLHRLQNATSEILELIEVQTGDYLGEDDIERFDDKYGRT